MPTTPKRSDQRLGHRTQAERARTTTVAVQAGEVDVPAPGEQWHDIARDWYLGLASSGQARFMEPSDWQAARYVAEVITKNLEAPRFSAQLFAAVWTAMNDLLTTESARRRAHIELERAGGDTPSDADVPKLDDYRSLYA